MNRLFINSFIFTTLLSATPVVADIASTKVIYGIDNRIETYQASQRDQKLASATAGMIISNKLIDIGENFLLPPSSLTSGMGLCGGERFADQPSATICSGFLVGPNLLVTAGHCISNAKRCGEVKFVFDYKLDKITKRAKIITPKSNVYSCKRVVDANIAGSQDYSLIELDRSVIGVKPLKYRTSGMIKNRRPVMTIGHPSGLPQKVTSGAKVFVNNKNSTYFKTNLDAFSGNSGSAVFDDITGIVEGILVRGARDYILGSSGDCIIANRVGENMGRNGNLGESVTRITEIPALKYRNKLFQAVRENDIKSALQLLSFGADVNLKNDSSLSSIELARLYNNDGMIKILSRKK